MFLRSLPALPQEEASVFYSDYHSAFTGLTSSSSQCSLEPPENSHNDLPEVISSVKLLGFQAAYGLRNIFLESFLNELEASVSKFKFEDRDISVALVSHSIAALMA